MPKRPKNLNNISEKKLILLFKNTIKKQIKQKKFNNALLGHSNLIYEFPNFIVFRKRDKIFIKHNGKRGKRDIIEDETQS